MKKHRSTISGSSAGFLPTTAAEVEQRGWQHLDAILISGDAYIDSPFMGIAVIGRVLLAAGFRVGIIAQPELESEDICRLGEPLLFWGVSGGSVDSMVANYTASGKRRQQDDYTLGGMNDRRPDRAVIVYANLIRAKYKGTRPIVLGGIEASLRRIAHYDWWGNTVRRSILLDAKADYLLYGMAERSVVELAECLRDDKETRQIRGLCYAAQHKPEAYLELSSYEEVAGTSHAHKQAFIQMFQTFYAQNDPLTGQGLAQRYGMRWLIQNPPQLPLTQSELDQIHELDYQLEVHPFDRQRGQVRALDTISFSIASHRGCYGECNFCAIAVHQGRTVTWRSKQSILREARMLSQRSSFKGRIQDVGGPTANMYGIECSKKLAKGCCPERRCLYPSVCPNLSVDHGKQITLLEELRRLPGIKQVVVSSGIRYDMILADTRNGLNYLRQVVRHHVSGQLKAAPEHCQPQVLACMGKPGPESLLAFRKLFTTMTQEEGLPQFLTYYMIAAHPGCTQKDMEELRSFCLRELKMLPKQVQIFTPTPSTWSTVMYWTGENPLSGKHCYVEKEARVRERQKETLTGAQPNKGSRKG